MSPLTAVYPRFVLSQFFFCPLEWSVENELKMESSHWFIYLFYFLFIFCMFAHIRHSIECVICVRRLHKMQILIFYAFFWVIPRRLNYICQGFCSIFMGGQLPCENDRSVKMEQTGCSRMLAYKIQTPRNHPEESIQLSEHGAIFKSWLNIIVTVLWQRMWLEKYIKNIQSAVDYVIINGVCDYIICCLIIRNKLPKVTPFSLCIFITILCIF